MLRKFAGSSSIAGQLVITGGKSSSGRYLTSSKIFTEDNVWEDLAELPVGTEYHCQVTVGDTIYLVGGDTPNGRTADMFKLNMTSRPRRWVKQRSLDTPRLGHACTEWEGGVVVIGGLSNSDRLSSVEWHNPVRNTWVTMAPLPTTLSGMQAVVWGNSLYVFGGKDDSNWSKAIYKLEKGQDTWHVLGATLQNFETRTVFPAVTLSNIHCKQN